MKGYKGFGPGMICRDKQYQENTEFIEQEAELCKSGMHFCQNPFDVWSFYPPVDEYGNFNEFAEVEATGDTQTDDDIKYCSSQLRIGAKLDLPCFIKAGVNFILRHAKRIDCHCDRWDVAANSGAYSAAINAGLQSAATNTGEHSAATNTGLQSTATNTGAHSAATNTGLQSTATNTGIQSVATNTGEYSVVANTGAHSAATNTGYRSIATNTGIQSVATNTGYRSTATNAGDYSVAANTGGRSVATNTGTQSVASVSGNESFAVVTGHRSKVKGAVGCWIACAEWGENDDGIWHPIDFKAVRVDGKKIKADTWYQLKHGKFIEVEEA